MRQFQLIGVSPAGERFEFGADGQGGAAGAGDRPCQGAGGDQVVVTGTLVEDPAVENGIRLRNRMLSRGG